MVHDGEVMGSSNTSRTKLGVRSTVSKSYLKQRCHSITMTLERLALFFTLCCRPAALCKMFPWLSCLRNIHVRYEPELLAC